MITNIYVSPAVNMLLLDIKTAGEFVPNPQINKLFDSNRIGEYLRVIIFGLGSDTFLGLIGHTTDAAYNVTGIVGSDPIGNDAGAIIDKCSQISVDRIIVEAIL